MNSKKKLNIKKINYKYNLNQKIAPSSLKSMKFLKFLQNNNLLYKKEFIKFNKNIIKTYKK